MRDLLDKRADAILQGNDLKTWNKTWRNYFYTGAAFIIYVFVDQEISLLLPRWLGLSYLLLPAILFPMSVYYCYIYRANVKTMTKRYLTHLSDEELDKEVSLTKWSFFKWITNTN